MDYSIIVPHHSNRRLLEYCLATLRTSVPPEVEIIVILNNSNKAEINIPVDRKRFLAIRVNSNLGYDGAITAGAEIARGKRIVLCDNDTFYRPGWFETLATFYSTTPRIGVASAKLISPQTSRIVDYGIAFTKYNAPHPFMDQLPEYTLTQSARKFQAVCSATMMIDRSLFMEVNPSKFKGHSCYNDIELCLNINELQRDCWVVGNCVAYHKSSFEAGAVASYKQSALKGDQKAQFMSSYSHKIVADMDYFYLESFRHLSLHASLARSYILIDVSTIVDRWWYHDIIRQFTRIVEVYELPSHERDATQLSLMDHLGINILRLRVPLIYFVDRFTSLTRNSLWLALRPYDKDLVVDRNANVLFLEEIVVLSPAVDQHCDAKETVSMT